MGHCRASVIINSYNYGQFLGSAIDSALAQSYRDTEIVVVDDGSTDQSADIIKSYGDRVFTILKANGGQASALNAGFQASSGDVILFLDSDDVLFSTAVEESVKALQNPSVFKAQWNLVVIDGSGNATGRLFPDRTLRDGNLSDVARLGGPGAYTWPPTSGNAWSRRFLNRVLPIPEAQFRTCPDLYLCTLAPVFGLVKTIEPQSCWRIHGTNNSWLGDYCNRLEQQVSMWEYCFGILRNAFDETGMEADMTGWRANSDWHQIHAAVKILRDVIPPQHTFILVDQNEWAATNIDTRLALPFTEKYGKYWGPPPDDSSAIRELQRLRACGATHLVFAWPAFWWLEHYKQFASYVRINFRLLISDERVIIYDLRRVA